MNYTGLEYCPKCKDIVIVTYHDDQCTCIHCGTPITPTN